jgi:hypothetical protein
LLLANAIANDTNAFTEADQQNPQTLRGWWISKRLRQFCAKITGALLVIFRFTGAPIQNHLLLVAFRKAISRSILAFRRWLRQSGHQLMKSSK